MLLAAQLSDDQIAILGCAIVFGGCLVMMLISQKIGDKVRGRNPQSGRNVVPFSASGSKSSSDRTSDRKAA